MNKRLIIAESNFLEQLIYDIYVGKQEFTSNNYVTIRLRLQSIRDEARKEDDGKTDSRP